MMINSTGSGSSEMHWAGWPPDSDFEVRECNIAYPCHERAHIRPGCLRIVVLDCHPVFTTIVILCGWMAKTAASDLVGPWVGVSGEAKQWFEYSIP